jgi:hypothetical protein
VRYDHGVLERGELALRVEKGVEVLRLLAKELRGDEDRQPRRIKEVPDLVVLADDRVVQEIIVQIDPGDGARQQAMHRDERDLVRVEGFRHIEACLVEPDLGRERLRPSNAL